jgi:hypothetical protein
MPETATAARALPRPRGLTIVGWLFIAVGSIGLLVDWLPLLTTRAPQHLSELMVEGIAGLALIWSVRLLAVIGGAGLLRGAGWARPLLAAWMLFHIGVSLLHSAAQFVVHLIVFAAISCVLVRPSSSDYFRPDHD